MSGYNTQPSWQSFAMFKDRQLCRQYQAIERERRRQPASTPQGVLS